MLQKLFFNFTDNAAVWQACFYSSTVVYVFIHAILIANKPISAEGILSNGDAHYALSRRGSIS